jgi:hypothetical protein
MINFFKSTKPTITFFAANGAPNVSKFSQVKLASDLMINPKWVRDQRAYSDNKSKFLNCPGMADWMKTGYIIPAWTNIKIRANRADTMLLLDDQPGGSPMSEKLVTGLFKPQDGVSLKVTKVPTPWGIKTKPGWSAHVLPALFHSPFLQDLYVYPGTVDYDNFHVCNFIFSAIKACDIEIPAGTPLLQVVPFCREEITAVCEKGSVENLDKLNFSYPHKLHAAYRKFFHQRKTYTMEYK